MLVNDQHFSGASEKGICSHSSTHLLMLLLLLMLMLMLKLKRSLNVLELEQHSLAQGHLLRQLLCSQMT